MQFFHASLPYSVFLEIVKESISKVDVVEDSFTLVKGNIEAIQEVLSVSVWELGRVIEARAIGGGISMILNSLDNMTKTISLESLLSNDSMDVLDWLGDVW